MLTPTPQNCDKRGNELSLYYNVGDDTTQVWVFHLGVVGDLNMPETEELNEQSNRDPARQVKEYNEGDIEQAITGTQITDPQYEGYAFLNAMRRGGMPGDCMALTGTIDEVGSTGWRGMYRNSDRSVNGPETGNMTTNFNLQPAACAAVKVRPVQIQTPGQPTDYNPASFSAVST